MFCRCCSSRSITSISHVHNPKPASYGDEIDYALKMLLLYIPNIDSVQSPQIKEISDLMYDDFIFQLILNKLGMNEETDVLFLENKSVNVDTEDWDYLRNNFCSKCQKMIISHIKSQSKTENLFRCIRNSIAHGDFFVSDGYFVGYNSQYDSKTKVNRPKAVIKVKLAKLIEAINDLQSPKTDVMLKVYLFCKALENLNYSIKQAGSHDPYDLIADKDNVKYFIEVISSNGSRFIHKDIIIRHSKYVEEIISTNEYFVLIVDKAKLTKDALGYLSDNKNIIVLDINNVKDLLAGVDVLRERLVNS